MNRFRNTALALSALGAFCLSSNAIAAVEKTIYKFCYSVPCPKGTKPPGSLVNVNGLLYGTAENGGKGYHGIGQGTIFAVDPTSGRETAALRFTVEDGIFPLAGLLQIGGLLYGTTSAGGSKCGLRGCGTVFSFDPATGTETVLHAFAGGGRKDGQSPSAGLIAVDGTLYGTTFSGGKADYGTVFAVDKTTGGEKVLHSFQKNGADGYWSVAGLLAEKNMLYGTTEQGGAHGDGTVFAIDPKTGAETVLHSFDGMDGAAPEAGLIAVKGLLYGTTVTGGAYNNGTVFSLDPQTGTETVVYSFCKETNCADGANPVANLIDMNGIIYGTTSSGGASQFYGTVFSLDPATGAETVLYSFCSKDSCADGWSPQGGLIDVGGTFYGTTTFGRLTHCGSLEFCGGVVFSLKP
ncbi:MAG TPA: choice-of-anchor tandem repeat GloVer-containing protein [Rhizomicrobium sp.]|jgi:uncharacterized repeat protein (TIGR03803 family)